MCRVGDGVVLSVVKKKNVSNNIWFISVDVNTFTTKLGYILPATFTDMREDRIVPGRMYQLSPRTVFWKKNGFTVISTSIFVLTPKNSLTRTDYVKSPLMQYGYSDFLKYFDKDFDLTKLTYKEKLEWQLWKDSSHTLIYLDISIDLKPFTSTITGGAKACLALKQIF